MAVVVTRTAFRQAAEDAGFIFEAESTTDGQPAVKGTRTRGSCDSVITLVGPEQAVRRAVLQMTGCDDQTMLSLAAAVVTPITAQWSSDQDVQGLLTWATSDILPLLEGQAGTSSKVIAGVTFKADSIAGPPHQLTLSVDLTKAQ